MFKRPIFVCVISLTALLLAGCPKRNELTPDHTLSGDADASRNREDWINEKDASNYSEGLVSRDASPFEGKTVQSIYNSIYFDFDTYTLSAVEREKLSRIANFMQTNPSQLIRLEGHCDWHGTAEYNLSLGDKRATTVKDYLVQMGVSPERIETLAKGSLEATPNIDKTTAAKDRRVDVLLMK